MDKIRNMIGKSYLHNGSQIKIENFTEKDGKITLVTDKGFIDKKQEEIEEFIDSLQPVTGSEIKLLPAIKVDTNTIGSLKDILMDNIKKVKESSDYIPQSEEINKNVKSIIDLAKTELDMIKTLRGL